MGVKNAAYVAADEAREIVALIGSGSDKVIPLLQEIQKRHNYLPEDLVEAVADEIKVPVADIYGVATFYSQFRFAPMGKHLIKVCKGTACHVQGADMLSSVLSEELGLDGEGTTSDMEFTMETVACLGCCSLAPVVMIDGKVFGKLTSSKVRKLIKGYRDGKN
ncbi:MAG: NADH-quinone oxidoreductase subunit NuoE [Spirochaetes bacterium]|nr:MAG: NADH-quinone oxidoreductase subunit NuoE [Spirochaetota bacterium]